MRTMSAVNAVKTAVWVVAFAGISAAGGAESFTDKRDGKTYRTVKMPDGKTWMAENLNYQTADASWCYNNADSNCVKYGRLYNWNTANTVCHSGWHLPTRREWGDLAVAVDGRNAYGTSGTAGKHLKSTTGWNSYSGIENLDTYGFSALPGGNRYSDGDFDGAGYYGYWWTATENGSGDAYSRGMNYDYDGVLEGYYDKDGGFSVRCVGD